MVGWLSFLHRGRNICCNLIIVVKGYYNYLNILYTQQSLTLDYLYFMF